MTVAKYIQIMSGEDEFCLPYDWINVFKEYDSSFECQRVPGARPDILGLNWYQGELYPCFKGKNHNMREEKKGIVVLLCTDNGTKAALLIDGAGMEGEADGETMVQEIKRIEDHWQFEL